jgi:cobalt/nickel transport protein
MDKKLRNLIIALLIIAIVTPIGLIAAGETFGEWSGEELVEKVGYVPQGIVSLWNAPLSDYGIPGLNAQVGYVISAFIGIVLCVGIIYLYGMLIAKREKEDR